MPDSTPHSQKTLQALWRLEKIILNSLDLNEVVQKIVDSTIQELDYLRLGYQIIVLSLVDKDKKVLKRISLSQTLKSRQAQEAMSVPFHDIIIPLSETRNKLIQALQTREPIVVTDWNDILLPVFTPDSARELQNKLGIKASLVLPVVYQNESIGTLIFSMDKSFEEVSQDEKDLMQGFTDVVGLAVQNASIYTRLQQTTNELKGANEKLKELDRLKDEFASIASHQLRTPLGSMRWNMEMVLNGDFGEISDEVKMVLEQMNESSHRMITLVNDLLSVSRLNQGRIQNIPAPTDLVAIIRSAVQEIEAEACIRDVTVECTCEAGAFPKVMVDPKLFREVAQNLISNSVKYSEQGGYVNIKVETVDGKLRVEFADQGIGIPEAAQERIFTKFFRAENAQLSETEGTGLGLFVVKSYVESWGGKVWFVSPTMTEETHTGQKSKRGTSFFIEFPIPRTADIVEKVI